MPAMWEDFVCEIGVAPGTGAVTLAGANPDIPCMTFLTAGYHTGDWVYYVITDGAAGGLSEQVMGQFNATAGTLSRATTIKTNTGGTTPLNFTTSVKVFTYPPASKVAYFDNNNDLTVPANIIVPNNTALQMKDTGGTARSVMFVDGANKTVITAATTAGTQILDVAGNPRITVDNSAHVTVIGTIFDVTDGSTIVRSAGNSVQIGTTSNPLGANLNVLGSTTTVLDSITGNNVILRFTGTTCGTIITNGSTTAYNTSSDYRIKMTFGPADVGALIDSVPVYDGAYTRFPSIRRPMMLAHEMPTWAMSGAKDAVDENGDPVYQQADYMALIPAMWAELQSLRRRVAELENA